MCTKCKKPVINVSNLLSENIEMNGYYPPVGSGPTGPGSGFSVMPIRIQFRAFLAVKSLKIFN